MYAPVLNIRRIFTKNRRDAHTLPCETRQLLRAFGLRVINVEVGYPGAVRKKIDLVLYPDRLFVVECSSADLFKCAGFQVGDPERRRKTATIVTPVAGTKSRIIRNAASVGRHR